MFIITHSEFRYVSKVVTPSCVWFRYFRAGRTLSMQTLPFFLPHSLLCESPSVTLYDTSSSCRLLPHPVRSPSPTPTCSLPLLLEVILLPEIRRPLLLTWYSRRPLLGSTSPLSRTFHDSYPLRPIHTLYSPFFDVILIYFCFTRKKPFTNNH